MPTAPTPTRAPAAAVSSATGTTSGGDREPAKLTDPYVRLGEAFDRLAGTRPHHYDVRVTPEQLDRLVEGLLLMDDPEDRALGRRLSEALREGDRSIDLTEETEVVGEYDDGAIRESRAATAADHNRSRP